MIEHRASAPRTVRIADHLWDVLGAMAAEMGSDRDSLLNQALHAFARRNGFLVGPRGSGPARQISTPAAPLKLGENALEENTPCDEAAGTSPALPTALLPELPAPVAAAALVLSRGRGTERVEKDRFVIGRGKHCDLIIQSGKVSREHAVIVRDGTAWFIQDLGSSNGTWFDKRRIDRRQIDDGDEYYISSEKIGCSLR